MTIKELYKLVVGELAKGNGDKEVFISCDDEGNGFHQLFQGFENNPEEIKTMVNLGLLPVDTNISNIVILGYRIRS